MTFRNGAVSLGDGSALVRELRSLSPTQRRALGTTVEMLEIWDGVTSCVALMIDDSDERTLPERLNTYFEDRFGSLDQISENDVDKIANEAKTLLAGKIPDWAEDLQRIGVRKFILRAVGEAKYQRLSFALKEDVAIIAVALRRAAKALKPFAVALDDLYATLPAEERLKLPTTIDLPNSMLSLMLVLDAQLDKLVDFSAPVLAVDNLPAELAVSTKNDLLALVGELREIVSGRSRDKVKALSVALGRKVQGARDALQYSADSVAQAANSLIELIDRLLRAAFTDEEVLAWINKSYPKSQGLTWIDKGVTKPTKRGQILCFVHAGTTVDAPSIIHELAATALTKTRTQLQKLKHADQGTEEELQQIRQSLAAVEGFLHLAIGIAWAVVPEEQIEALRSNLDARR